MTATFERYPFVLGEFDERHLTVGDGGTLADDSGLFGYGRDGVLLVGGPGN